MGFLAFVGALFLFAVLMLAIPRTAFAVTLLVCLKAGGVAIFVPSPHIWQIAAVLAFIIMIIVSLILDAWTIKTIHDQYS